MKFLQTEGRLQIVRKKEWALVTVQVTDKDLDLSLPDFSLVINQQLRTFDKGEVVHFKVITDISADEIDLICDTVPSLIALAYSLQTHKDELVFLSRDTIRNNVYLPIMTLNQILNRKHQLGAFTITIENKNGLLWNMINEEVKPTI